MKSYLISTTALGPDVIVIQCWTNHLRREADLFQHYYPPHFDYLSKMGRMNKEQPVLFELFTLSDFKKCSSTALKNFNNYIIIMTNNSDKIRILWVWCFLSLCCLFLSLFDRLLKWIIKYFQNLENLIFNILKEKKIQIFCLMASFFLKTV